MQVSSISFGYSHRLKTLYKQGKLPTVVNGFYGGKLTVDTVTLEHLKPHSKGGGTSLENLVLATAKNNHARGNQPLKDFLNPKAMEEYLAQFKDIKVSNFDGNKYIEKIRKTVERLINV
jgi:Leucine-rich repeat (LRR) protein